MSQIIEENIVKVDDNENDLSIFDEKDFPYEDYTELIQKINYISSILPNLNLERQKDIDQIEKEVSTFYSRVKDIKMGELMFHGRTIVDIRKNIKLEKKKKKQNKDKSKYFVNLQKKAPLFVLKMMNKDEDDTVSQSQVLTSLIQKIKTCIQSEPKTYNVYKEDGKIDNTKFYIKGELLEFFNNIKKEAKERGDDIHIPDMLGYPNLMAYLKYVIYK